MTEVDLRADAVEAVMVEAMRRETGGGVACAVIDGSSPLTYLARMVERARFPDFDMDAAMAPFDDASLFLHTVDLDRGRVGHVQRLVRGRSAAASSATGLTLIEVLDDRVSAIDPAERASIAEILAHHGIGDTGKVWNIATSCATERVAPTRHRPYSLLSYKGLMRVAQPIDVIHFFAYVNRKTVRSMDRVGIPSTLAGGREFHLPVPGGYDSDYVGIHLEIDEATVRAFTVADPSRPLSRPVADTEIPVMVFVHDDDHVVDLRDSATSPHVGLTRLGSLASIDLPGGAVGPDGSDDAVVLDLTDPEVTGEAVVEHGREAHRPGV